MCIYYYTRDLPLDIVKVARIINGHSGEGLETNSIELFSAGPPTNVRATDSTSTTITVQWERGNCIHRNGEITGYMVRPL